MQVILYKRHEASCAHQDDKHYRRCQTRKSAKTASWGTAPDKTRAIAER
jgi:hypothetical protein